MRADWGARRHGWLAKPANALWIPAGHAPRTHGACSPAPPAPWASACAEDYFLVPPERALVPVSSSAPARRSR